MRRTNWKRRRKIEDYLAILQILLVVVFTIAFIVFVATGYLRVRDSQPREPTRIERIGAGEEKGLRTAGNS